MANNSVIVIEIVISGVFCFDSLWSLSGRKRPFEKKNKKQSNNKGDNVSREQVKTISH